MSKVEEFRWYPVPSNLEQVKPLDDFIKSVLFSQTNNKTSNGKISRQNVTVNVSLIAFIKMVKRCT